MPPPKDLTDLLASSAGGDERAADQLAERVYTELHSIAERLLRNERSDHTLQATALVNEVYIRLVDAEKIDWQGETHFRRVAARAMQRLLIDHGRKKSSEKRGGDWRRIALDSALPPGGAPDCDIGDFSEALDRLKSLDERMGEVVELHLLGGLTLSTIGDLLDVSLRTAERDWAMSRAWLRRELKRRGDDD